jgi:hypothetical protein
MTIYLKKRKGPPVLLCDPDGDVKGVPQWKAWCPFCATYHRHGAEQGTASRRCHTDSPFNDGGYVSRLRRNAEVADARRKRKAQRW